MSRADEFSDSLPLIALNLSAKTDRRYVLETAVAGLVDAFGASLARIWANGPPGRSRYRSLKVQRRQVLRLVAESHRDVDLEPERGREVMAAPWVVQIAASRQVISSSRLYHGRATPDAGWMRDNGFRTFAGFPLSEGDRLLGVLAVFTRYPMTDRANVLLKVFAGQLAARLRDTETAKPQDPGNGLLVKQGSSLDAAMKAYIEYVLQQTDGRIEGPSGAARILDIHPNTLRSRMEKLGVARA